MILKYGMAAGILLLSLVIVVAIALGAKAARSVASSRNPAESEPER